MDSTEPVNSTTEDVIVASPRVESFEVPKEGIQVAFDEQNQDQGQATSLNADVPWVNLQEQEQDSGAVVADDGISNELKRGGAASRGKGRGGGRVASTASAKGKDGSASKGSSSTGRGGKSGASSSGRGGAKGGKVTNAKGGKGGASKAIKASKDQSSNNAEASGSGGIDGNITGGGIGSGPSNTIFPLARVSRIVKVDKEIEMTSKDAIWTIAVATELFIKHLTDSAYAKARLDKKKTVTFKELASAVESQNEFFFLQDIIPQAVPFSKALEMRQEIEEKNHMREAGLFDDEEEDVQDAAPLLNQTISDEIEETTGSKEKVANPADEVDEQGDMAMEEKLEAPAALPNGHSDEKVHESLVNGTTSSRDEEMMI